MRGISACVLAVILAGCATSPPPSASATPTGSATAPAGEVQPTSVSFLDARLGWVLGTTPCDANPCATVAETQDGGATWRRMEAPTSSLSELAGQWNAGCIVFADARDGWAFGGAGVWSTHDGAVSWHRIALPGWGPDSRLVSLAVSSDRVLALVVSGSIDTEETNTAQLLRAPLSSDSWRPSADVSGIATGGAIAAAGSEVWVRLDFVTNTVIRATLFVSGDGGASWAARKMPCADGDIAVADGAGLVVCGDGAAAGSQGKRAYLSLDTGRSFRRLSDPPLAGDLWFAALANRDIPLVGATSGASFIYRSPDRGATWSTAWQGDQGYIDDLTFPTASFGVFALSYGPLPNAPRGQLMVSTDGGVSWHAAAVRLASP
jgi:hypothetical protein